MYFKYMGNKYSVIILSIDHIMITLHHRDYDISKQVQFRYGIDEDDNEYISNGYMIQLIQQLF